MAWLILWCFLHCVFICVQNVNSNLLRDPGAELSSSGDSPWEYQTREMTAQKAMKTNVDGENVFEIGYKDAMAVDDLYIRQSFMIPANVTAVRMSARMRQNATSGPAFPLLTLQVADNISYYLEWDNPVDRAWQWAAMDITLNVSQSGMDLNATVVMNVTLANSSMPNGVVYFDDISVVPLPFVTSVDDILLFIVKIAAPSAGVLLLLVAIVVLVACCCCCYYCGCCKRHNNAEPMRKETMRQRFTKWTTRYRASNHPTVEDDETNNHQHYTPLQAVGPESVYTRPGKDAPLYASLARAGGNNSVSGEGFTSSGEQKEYYYIQQPASVPERNVSSASIIGTSTFLLPPPHGDRSGSQSSLASRELPLVPNATHNTIADSQEPTEDYLQLVPATSPPVSGGKEEVTTDVDAKFEPTVEDAPNMETTATAEIYYTNDSVGAQINRPPMDRQPTYDQVYANEEEETRKSHPPVDRQPTYDKVYANEEEGTRKSHPPVGRQPTYDKVYANEEVAENGNSPVGRQPTYENTDSFSFSRPALRHQPTSEEVYVVVT